MYSKDPRVEGCRRACVVEGASVCGHTETLGASVERRADRRELAVDGLRRDAFKLTHLVIRQQHAEEGPLAAEASAVMREVASEDRSVPPAHALRIDPQRGSPERSLRVVKDTGKLVAEGLPGLLGREAAGLVEAGLLAVAVTGSRSVHVCEDASGLGPSRCLDRATAVAMTARKPSVGLRRAKTAMRVAASVAKLQDRQHSARSSQHEGRGGGCEIG